MLQKETKTCMPLLEKCARLNRNQIFWHQTNMVNGCILIATQMNFSFLLLRSDRLGIMQHAYTHCATTKKSTILVQKSVRNAIVNTHELKLHLNRWLFEGSVVHLGAQCANTSNTRSVTLH